MYTSNQIEILTMDFSYSNDLSPLQEITKDIPKLEYFEFLSA